MSRTDKLAFQNASGKIFKTGKNMMDDGITTSRSSRRKRILLPLHRTQDAVVQRLINFLQPGTYIRPHQHPGDHQVESLVVIKGSILFIIFDETGFIEHYCKLSASGHDCIIDIEPGVWHTFVVLDPDTVIYEAKKGPYDAATDKVFASWSPEEYTTEADEWVKSMETINE
jgi:cupin fold WbuC family metalloprotein